MRSVFIGLGFYCLSIWTRLGAVCLVAKVFMAVEYHSMYFRRTDLCPRGIPSVAFSLVNPLIPIERCVAYTSVKQTFVALERDKPQTRGNTICEDQE